MTEAQKLFDALWQQYVSLSPSARAIHDSFLKAGERVVHNDHVAFRTFDDPRVNIDVMQTPFVRLGYVEKGTYRFEQKKLFAKHFEHEDPSLPKVFISELLTSQFSPLVQQTVAQCLDACSAQNLAPERLVFAERPWSVIDHARYEQLARESEYASWMYVHGFRVNHFTVFVNALQKFDSLQSVNAFLQGMGVELNAAGGVIKGTAAELLEQSSTLAEPVSVRFSDGEHMVPSCYYEFARRYADASGKLYSGFIAASADKIFESTDRR